MATGTESEFEEFARARARPLYRSAWLLCGDRHQAEDLVQETLAKVYVAWRRPLGSRLENPAAYAQTTLVRTHISAQRRRSSTERPVAWLPERAAPGSGPDLQLTLAAALARLEPLDRAVLVLRYLDDVSVEDTALCLGVSSGAVRNRSLRALQRIRPLLGDATFTDLLTS